MIQHIHRGNIQRYNQWKHPEIERVESEDQRVHDVSKTPTDSNHLMWAISREEVWILRTVSCCTKSLSRVWLCVAPWTVACQAPLSMGFFRQEYWSNLPCPPPADLPDSGIKTASLKSPALAGSFFFFFLPLVPHGKPRIKWTSKLKTKPNNRKGRLVSLTAIYNWIRRRMMA